MFLKSERLMVRMPMRGGVSLGDIGERASELFPNFSPKIALAALPLAMSATYGLAQTPEKANELASPPTKILELKISGQVGSRSLKYETTLETADGVERISEVVGGEVAHPEKHSLSHDPQRIAGPGDNFSSAPDNFRGLKVSYNTSSNASSSDFVPSAGLVTVVRSPKTLQDVLSATSALFQFVSPLIETNRGRTYLKLPGENDQQATSPWEWYRSKNFSLSGPFILGPFSNSGSTFSFLNLRSERLNLGNLELSFSKAWTDHEAKNGKLSENIVNQTHMVFEGKYWFDRPNKGAYLRGGVIPKNTQDKPAGGLGPGYALSLMKIWGIEYSIFSDVQYTFYRTRKNQTVSGPVPKWGHALNHEWFNLEYGKFIGAPVSYIEGGLHIKILLDPDFRPVPQPSKSF
jgi:hypothetical protein